MYEQPRYKPLQPSQFFEDGPSSRPLVAGTVPGRTSAWTGRTGSPDEVFYTGRSQGNRANRYTFEVEERSLAARAGAVPHLLLPPATAELGDGQGMIVQRGFNPPPPVSQR